MKIQICPIWKMCVILKNVSICVPDGNVRDFFSNGKHCHINGPLPELCITTFHLHYISFALHLKILPRQQEMHATSRFLHCSTSFLRFSNNFYHAKSQSSNIYEMWQRL